MHITTKGIIITSCRCLSQVWHETLLLRSYFEKPCIITPNIKTHLIERSYLRFINISPNRIKDLPKLNPL